MIDDDLRRRADRVEDATGGTGGCPDTVVIEWVGDDGTVTETTGGTVEADDGSVTVIDWVADR